MPEKMSPVDPRAAAAGKGTDSSNGSATPKPAGGEDPSQSDLLGDLNKYREDTNSKILRLEGALNQLVALLTPNPDDETLEPAPQETQSILDLLPQDGVEDLKPFLTAVAEREQELRQKISDLETQQGRAVGQKGAQNFEVFKAMNPGWEDHDKTMAQLCDDFGYKPEKLEDFAKLYHKAQKLDGVSAMTQELEKAKKAGPVPNLAPPVPSLASRIRANRSNSKGPDLAGIVHQGFETARTKISGVS